MRDGELVTVYNDENVNFLIVVSFNIDKNFIVAFAAFLNHTEKPITIYPEHFQIKMSAPVNKVYNALDTETVAKKIKNQGRWRSILAAGLAGMATRQSTGTITDNRGNTATVIITEPDHAAQRNARRSREAREVANQTKADKADKWALKTHTLFKGETVDGAVFFKREKLAPGMILSFTIGDTIFEIPYGDDRVPKKE